MISTAVKRIIVLFLVLQAVLVTCSNTLRLSGVASCLENSTIAINFADVEFNKGSATVYYNVSGTSNKQQIVQASLTVVAYGQPVFQRSFNPCDNSTFISQLCPVPEGRFSTAGSQKLPLEYLNKIPSVAFTLPDIDATAKLEITSQYNDEEQACISSSVTNGKSLQFPAITAISSAMIGASLLLAGASALSSAGAVGSTSPSPNFAAVFGWFQSIAMNGMLSVPYPPIYRSFCQNFGFSTGLVSFDALQTSLDGFSVSMRTSTAGLQTRTRHFHSVTPVLSRDVPTASVNGSSLTSSNAEEIVSGIQSYADMLSIPQANVFLTVLVVFAMVVATVIVGILGLKTMLEIWALFASFPSSLSNFRKRYWRTLANTLATLILLLYGIWTIWCIYQWTNSDSSWVVRALAAITWSLFTAVILCYTVKLFLVVRWHKQEYGNTTGLYDDSDTWQKYSFLYDSYRQGYWWAFVPVVIYTFAKGVIIAVGNGHGMVQTIAQLTVELLMLLLLICTRPFATRGSNWINSIIQIVRVLSVACILVFVEQIGISQNTKTMTGLALIIVQSVLTGILGILLAVNALRACIMTNPHVRHRKEAKSLQKQLRTSGSVSSYEDTSAQDSALRELANQKPRDRLSRPLHIGRTDVDETVFV